MVEDKLLTIRDASVILGISEKEVIDLAENGQLPAYKLGGVYLRFKREQLEGFRKKNKSLLTGAADSGKDSFRERVADFFYFYDFYIVASCIVILMLAIIFRGY